MRNLNERLEALRRERLSQEAIFQIQQSVAKAPGMKILGFREVNDGILRQSTFRFVAKTRADNPFSAEIILWI